jgi:hypothetical protein
MKLDWPPIEQLQKECGALLHQALLRGWRSGLLAKAFVVRARVTGVMPSPSQLLQAILQGEFDYLFFDSTGQSFS